MSHSHPMRARRRRALGAATLLWSATAAAQEPSTAAAPPAHAPAEPSSESDVPFSGSATLQREALVREVLARNPGLQAAREAWQAALARVPQASALEDPMLSYGVAPFSIGSRQVPYGQEVKLGQALPFPGKHALKGEVAAAEAAAARNDWVDARQRLALMASLLFDDSFVAHRALAINAEHLELLRALKKSAEAQYVVGRASQADPLQAEVQLGELMRERLTLETQRNTLRAQLNALLHRAPQLPLPPPPESLAFPEADPMESTSLQEEALRQRPELEALRARVGGREAAVRLAQREYLPDFELMGSYNSMWMDPQHRLMVGVGLNIPFFQLGKRKAAVQEAEADLRGMRRDEARLVDAIRAEVDQARERLMEARGVATLERERILPAARDQVAAARAGFTTGRNSFLAVIEAERSLRNARLRVAEALADVQRRQAELDRAVGLLPAVAAEGETR